MDILNKARRLESTLAKSLDEAARRFAKSGARQPLEVLHAIVETAEGGLEPAGRGGRVFPFNRVTVFVVALSADAQSRFEAVFAAAPSLHTRIVERLAHAGCDAGELNIEVQFVKRPEAHWANPEFHLEFDRVAPVTAPPATELAPPPDQIKLVVAAGTAQKPAYALALDRINLGRCAEVRDSRHRLIRTNHVAFTDEAGGLNHTVSRRHAHIHYSNDGAYRLCDDGSAHGTSVVRNGKTIPVPAGARGIRLQSGDEIVLGDARLRVRFG